MCFYGQRPVALAALLVKPTEKFQKLQTHIVDVAAQQVQRQIQGVADEAMTTKPTTFPVVAPSILNTCASTAPDSISAISENDLELANKVIATDDEVDNYFAEMRQHLTTVMQQKPQYVPQYVDYLMIAKYVERIADHSTNIAQWVMFVVKNELKN